jgi:outer membrane protein insertion porin family
MIVVSLPVSAQTLENIKFSGNYHVPEKILLESLEQVRVGETLNEEKVKKDVRNIFDTGFFYEVNAEIKENEVIFNVKQNPVLTKFDVEGNHLINDKEIKQNLKTSKDRIYNEKRLKKDILEIYRLYEEKGYLGTQIEDILYTKDRKNTTEKAERGFLKLILQEGYVKNIKIVGLENTNESIIKSLIKINKNEYLTIEKAEKTIKDIYDTEFFQSVNLDTKLNENKDGIDVIFNVKEAKTGSYEVGLGYNEKKGTMLIGNIKEKNLFGTGKQVGLESDINELGHEISGFYRDPYLPKNYEFDLNFDFGKEELVENEEEINTDYKRISTLLTKNMEYGSYYGGIKLENYKSNLERNDHGRLVALNGGYYIDNTNKKLDPNKGQYLNLNVELAEEFLGSEINYNKFTGKYYQYFKGFKENHSLATKLVLGVGSENLPYFKEYIASNSRHLKSYDFGDLRGNRMIVGSIEYRIPIWENKMILLGGFSFGDAWRTNERNNDFKTELVLGTKFSLAGMNNVRVDYAINEDKEGKFQISMGNRF